MPAEFEDTDLSGARFTRIDLRGARFRDSDMRGVKIDAFLTDANISGDIDGLRVNDVLVADYVEAELDRRYPERARLRARDAEGIRDAWALVESLWAPTVERARQLPEAVLHERVDGEWSFVETLRHLMFATDAWVKRTILGEAEPYHPLALPFTGIGDPRRLGIDADVDPSFDEVLAARLEHTALVRSIVDAITPAEYARTCAPNEAPGYPPNTEVTVGRCLGNIVREEWAHHRFATRDLDVLTGETGEN